MKKFFSILTVFAMTSVILSNTAAAASSCDKVFNSQFGTVVVKCIIPENDIICDNTPDSEPEIIFPDIEIDTPTDDTDAPSQDTDTNNPGQDNDIPTEDVNLHEYEKEVIRLVNEIRAENGLNGLEADVNLSNVARIKSQDMKDNNYFSHTSPVYGSPFDMMKQFGISYRTAGENIAKGQRTPQEVVNAWMNSEGHRANILNASFNRIGVGYVADGNYWTQMFIGV